MKQALKILIINLLLANQLAAQHQTHVLHLKNGSVLRGKIMENSTIRVGIETCCGNIFFFPAADVESIDIEQKKLQSKEGQAEDNQTKSKFYSYSTIGMILGQSDIMEGAGYSLRTSVGYEFSRFASLGFGIGIESYTAEMIPLFITHKSEFMAKENTPFVSMQFGYALPKNKKINRNYYDFEYSGGITAGLEIGICSYRKPNRGFTISAGYQYQRLIEESTYQQWGGFYTTERNIYDFNKIVVKIGLLYK
jgi:hypothetical protein